DPRGNARRDAEPRAHVGTHDGAGEAGGSQGKAVRGPHGRHLHRHDIRVHPDLDGDRLRAHGRMQENRRHGAVERFARRPDSSAEQLRDPVMRQGAPANEVEPVNTEREIRSSGFTLVEMMVALVLFTVVIGSIYSIYVRGEKSQQVGIELAEATQNARSVVDLIARELRSAGYGVD